jgi:sugar phosphate isomerase/epimerase
MQYKLTGIADEAGASLKTQLRAHQILGWDSIEARVIEIDGVKGNIHEVPDATFAQACELLQQAKISVCGFGSLIGNWAKKITDDYSITSAEIDRCITRMNQLGTKMVRIMSYAVCRDDQNQPLTNQHEQERLKRLNDIVQRFSAHNITVLHENCMNWGGMSLHHVHQLQDAIPDLAWVFDTGNPVFIEDHANSGQRQNAWDMYQAIKPKLKHIHIKDAIWNPIKQDADYTYPGEGQGQVKRILTDLLHSGYQGYISIEPHVAVVFHDNKHGAQADPVEQAKHQFDSYIRYGQQLQDLINALN